jgi:hypothetical protein
MSPDKLPPLERPAHWPADSPLPTRRTADSGAARVLTGVFLVALIVLCAAFAVAALLGRPLGTIRLANLASAIENLLLLVPIVFVLLAVHEGGHALGGLLAGWRVQSLMLGPWRLMREDGRLRVRRHRVYLLYGGAALLSPIRWQEPAAYRRSRALLIAGGPLASLLLGATLLFVLYTSDIPVRELLAHRTTRLLAYTGLISIAIGIGTLVPIRQGAELRNDGLQLLLLVRSSSTKSDDWAFDAESQHAAIHVLASDRRPREWDDALVAQFTSLPKIQRLGFEHHLYLDRNEPAAARDTLQRALDLAARSTAPDAREERARFALEAAAFEGAWRGDAAAARTWRALAGPAAALDPHAAHLAAAAIAAADGSARGATRCLRAAARAARESSVIRVDLLRAATADRVAASVATLAPPATT